jgi:hypothetical protein
MPLHSIGLRTIIRRRRLLQCADGQDGPDSSISSGTGPDGPQGTGIRHSSYCRRRRRCWVSAMPPAATGAHRARLGGGAGLSHRDGGPSPAQPRCWCTAALQAFASRPIPASSGRTNRHRLNQDGDRRETRRSSGSLCRDYAGIRGPNVGGDVSLARPGSGGHARDVR